MSAKKVVVLNENLNIEENINPAFRFEPHQKALFDALNSINSTLGDFYMGALRVLFDPENPDRVRLAAHGIREMLKNLPKFIDVPQIAEGPRLGDSRNDFKENFNKIKKNNPPEETLRRIIEICEKFIEDSESLMPKRKENFKTLLNNLEHGPNPLPEPIENLRWLEWREYLDFFNTVAHETEKKTSLEKFTEHLIGIETFLLDRLKPRTFEEIDNIDTLIKEGEENDNP